MKIGDLLFLLSGFVVAGVWLDWPGSVAAQESQEVLLLKAGFVLKFPSFVIWPAGSAIDEKGFKVCLLGESDIEKALRDVARHRLISGSQPDVRQIYSPSEIDECHLLYIAHSEAGRIGEVVDQAPQQRVLTVSSMPGAADRGVMINLFPEKDMVRFEINRSAAEQAGLGIDFRLLEAASAVR